MSRASASTSSRREIRCYLVGAGPGDPGLLTVRGRELLQRAEVVVYDSLVNESLLSLCPPDCLLIYAGKRAGQHTMTQEEIHAVMIDHLRQGRMVLRLKGGDPFVFARGGEEMAAVDAAGFGFEVVPGVTAGSAVPAYAGIPLTHRDHAASVTFVTAHESDRDAPKADWPALARLGGTLVVFMGARSAYSWTSELVRHGMNPDTPTALIQWGTCSSQRAVFAPLHRLAAVATERGLGSPAIAVVGTVVALRDTLAWFEQKPLFGKTVVVTRSREQSGGLNQLLRDAGAEVFELPTLTIHPLAIPDDLLDRLPRFKWLAFSSGNGVEHFMRPLLKCGDVRQLAGLRMATVGDSTARVLAGFGIRADFIPDTFRADQMAAQWPACAEKPESVLYVCGTAAGRDFEQGLAKKGIPVERLEVYETRSGIDAQSPDARRLADTGADWITFCSGSAVRAFASAFPAMLDASQQSCLRVAALGPVTAEEVLRHGGPRPLVPKHSTIPDLVDGIVAAEISGDSPLSG